MEINDNKLIRVGDASNIVIPSNVTQISNSALLFDSQNMVNVTFRGNKNLVFEDGSFLNSNSISFEDLNMQTLNLSDIDCGCRIIKISNFKGETIIFPKYLSNDTARIEIVNSDVKNIIFPENLGFFPKIQNCTSLTELTIPQTATFANQSSTIRNNRDLQKITMTSMDGLVVPVNITNNPQLNTLVINNNEFSLHGFVNILGINKGMNVIVLSYLSKHLMESNYVLDFTLADNIISSNEELGYFDFKKYNNFYNNYLLDTLKGVPEANYFSAFVSYFCYLLGMFDNRNNDYDEILNVAKKSLDVWGLDKIRNTFVLKHSSSNYLQVFKNALLGDRVLESENLLKRVLEISSLDKMVDVIYTNGVLNGVAIKGVVSSKSVLKLSKFKDLEYIIYKDKKYDVSGLSGITIDEPECLEDVQDISIQAHKHGAKLNYNFALDLAFRYDKSQTDLNYLFYKKIHKEFIQNKKVAPDFEYQIQKLCFLLGMFDKDNSKANKSYGVVEYLLQNVDLNVLENTLENVVINLPDQDFIDFITQKKNVKYLVDEINRSVDKSEFVEFVFNYFKTEQELNISKGHRHTQLVPTMEFFQHRFVEQNLNGITPENEQIAREISKFSHLYGASLQEAFDTALKINEELLEMEKDTQQKYPAISENVAFAQMDSMSKMIADNTTQAIKDLDSIAQQEFTYEWLSKNDPKNFTLGFYCSCCAHIGGTGDGIMRASIILPNVRNLVIKKDGRIIAKSTLYINTKQGYAVFNNIELSETIKPEEKDRAYSKFLDGVQTFVEAYNNQNQVKIQKVNMGMELNDFSQEIIAHSKPSEVLEAIYFGEYGIQKHYNGNWENSQRTIWTQEDGLVQ